MTEEFEIDWKDFDRHVEVLGCIVDDENCVMYDRVRAVCLMARMLKLEATYHIRVKTDE